VASPSERRYDTNAEDGEGNRSLPHVGPARPEVSGLPENVADSAGPKKPGGDGTSIPNLHIREVRQGHKPGERYVRVHRPFHDTFREASSDTLVARDNVYAPRGTVGRAYG
jgi:hypothetical protein